MWSKQACGSEIVSFTLTQVGDRYCCVYLIAHINTILESVNKYSLLTLATIFSEQIELLCWRRDCHDSTS